MADNEWKSLILAAVNSSSDLRGAAHTVSAMVVDCNCLDSVQQSLTRSRWRVQWMSCVSLHVLFFSCWHRYLISSLFSCLLSSRSLPEPTQFLAASGQQQQQQ